MGGRLKHGQGSAIAPYQPHVPSHIRRVRKNLRPCAPLVEVESKKPRTFERWLAVDRLEGGPGRVPLRTRALYDNLLHATEAPYPDREKADLLRELYCPTQPQKTLLVLRALHEIAEKGSPEAEVAFEQVSSRWLGDDYLKSISLKTWQKGARFIVRAQRETRHSAAE